MSGCCLLMGEREQAETQPLQALAKSQDGTPSSIKKSEICFHFPPVKIIFKVWFAFQTVLRAEQLKGWGWNELGMVVTWKCAKNYLNLGDIQGLDI